MMGVKQNKIVRIFCNKCVRKMKHRILSSVVRSGMEEIYPEYDIDISWEEIYEVLQCQECDNVTLKVSHWNSEAQYSHYKKEYSYSYYPPIVSRPKPIWFDKLEPSYKEVLNEVYVALDVDARFLATFGARTALDMLIVDKIGDVGSFKEKLSKLESELYIDATEKELLDAVLETGHAAAHRAYAPDGELLESVIDILESLFDRIYFKPIRDKELLKKARDLKRTTPKR